MAEGVGFEPTVGLTRRWFSRPVLSAAQTPLHQARNIRHSYRFVKA